MSTSGKAFQVSRLLALLRFQLFPVACACLRGFRVRVHPRPERFVGTYTRLHLSHSFRQPKNRAPAEKQITAEQLVREAQEFKTEPFQKQKTIITDQGRVG